MNAVKALAVGGFACSIDLIKWTEYENRVSHDHQAANAGSICRLERNFGLSIILAEILLPTLRCFAGCAVIRRQWTRCPRLGASQISADARLSPGGRRERIQRWHVKVRIDGKTGGKLAGKRIISKDSVCLLAVPMMNGSTILEGYIPEDRRDDCGLASSMPAAPLPGRRHCEFSCLSGGSQRERKDRSDNPRRLATRRGGSSSGRPRSSSG